MPYFQRHINILKTLENKSCFLFGPRQTGKTSLIKHQLAEFRYINLLESDVYLALSTQPSRLREICLPTDKIVIIDEIQKLPILLNEVHLLVEEKRINFLLTGSSARSLRKSGVNLLGGRARSLLLLPLTSDELGNHWLLNKALSVGTLPSIYLSKEPHKELRDYIGTYLKEEISFEGQVRNLQAFSRFLEVAALCNSQVLNYSKIANDAQVPPSTVQEYFQILYDTLIGTSLPAWAESKKRKASKTAKFYFFDIGVARAILARGDLSDRDADYGMALESLIFQELRAYTEYKQLPSLKHWNVAKRYEVDFILANSVAIEVKSSKNINKRHLKSLIKLKEEEAHSKFYLVCNEPLERLLEGINIVPIEKFLKLLWEDKIINEI